MRKLDWLHSLVTALLSFALTIPLCSANIRNPYLNTRRHQQHVNEVYNGCGYTKNCLKLCPEDNEACKHCIHHHNCPAIVTIKYDHGILRSQMLISHLGPNDEYISMGFSTDGRMRRSPFVACVSITNYNGSGSIPAKQMMYAGFTRLDYTVKYLPFDDDAAQHFYNREIRIESDDEETVEDAARGSELVEGPSLQCDFEWKTEFEISYGGATGNTKYKLLDPKTPYHIIAAKGSAGDAIHGRHIIRGHSRIEYGRAASRGPIILTKVPSGDLDDDYDEYYDSPAAEKMNQGKWTPPSTTIQIQSLPAIAVLLITLFIMLL